MKKLAICIMITLTTIITAKAQNLSISGKVTGQKSLPLSGAGIVLLRLRILFL